MSKISPDIARTCIIDDYRRGKSAAEAYKSFCGIIGDVDYVDFDYWWKRFQSGNFDFGTFDLTALPHRAVSKLLSHLNHKDHFRLRKVSKGIRELINRRFSHNKTLLLDIYEHGDVIEFGGRTYFFDKHGNTTNVKNKTRNYFRNREFQESHRMQCGYDFASLLMIEGLKLDSLIIDVKMEWTSMKSRNDVRIVLLNDIYSVLAQMSNFIHHKIPVKRLVMRVCQESNVEAILPLLEPGTLEVIDIGYWNRRVPKYPRTFVEQPVSAISIRRISYTEQWKKAKYLYLRRFKVTFDSITPFLHFNQFETGFTRIRSDMYYYLKPAILANPNFISCYITSRCQMTFKLTDCRIPGRDDQFLKMTTDERSVEIMIFPPK